MTKKFPLTNWSEKKAFTIKLGAVKKYHIAVFADPNCPWCKRFFEETRTNSTIWRSLLT